MGSDKELVVEQGIFCSPGDALRLRAAQQHWLQNVFGAEGGDHHRAHADSFLQPGDSAFCGQVAKRAASACPASSTRVVLGRFPAVSRTRSCAARAAPGSVLQMRWALSGSCASCIKPFCVPEIQPVLWCPTSFYILL